MWKRLKNLLHIHRFKINELEPGRSHRDTEAIYYVRRFITIRWGGEDGKQIYAGHLEVRITRPKLDLGWQLKIGSKASETPWDGYIKLFGFSAYWGFENGKKLAHFLTSRKGGYHNRQTGFYTYSENRGDRDLYWSFWSDDDAPRGKHRSGSFSLSPAEWIKGSLRYKYLEVAKFDTELELPDGTYPVTITLQRQIRYRTKRPNQILEQKWVLDVDAPKGVPTHYDKSGGWKGDRTYGWGVPFKEIRMVAPQPIEVPKVEAGVDLEEMDIDFNQSKYLIETRMIGNPLEKVVDPEWKIDAKAAVLGWVYTHRAKTGFREPQEQENGR